MGAPVANVGVANLPNQLHRLLSRKGTDFTLMVVGRRVVLRGVRVQLPLCRLK